MTKHQQTSELETLAQQLQDMRTRREQLANRSSQIAARLEIARLDQAKYVIAEVEASPELRAEIGQLEQQTAELARAIAHLDGEIAASETRHAEAQANHAVSNAIATLEQARTDFLAARNTLAERTLGFLNEEFLTLYRAAVAAEERGRTAATQVESTTKLYGRTAHNGGWSIDRFRSPGEATLITSIVQYSVTRNI